MRGDILRATNKRLVPDFFFHFLFGMAEERWHGKSAIEKELSGGKPIFKKQVFPDGNYIYFVYFRGSIEWDHVDIVVIDQFVNIIKRRKMIVYQCSAIGTTSYEVSNIGRIKFKSNWFGEKREIILSPYPELKTVSSSRVGYDDEAVVTTYENGGTEEPIIF